MIIFVDDEPRRMETYVDDLKLCYEVKFIDNVDEAIEFFVINQKNIQVLILDCVMPSGLTLKHTQYGGRTGISFYEYIRRKNITLPIILFSNFRDQVIIQELEKDQYCKFIKKEDVNANVLSIIIKDFLNKK